MRHSTLDSWAVKCLTQCCAFSLWDQSAPATSSLSSSHKGDQAGVPDSCTWLGFLGKQLKSLTLQMISPKHHPYKRRLIQPYSLRETRNSKRQAGWKEEGLDFLTQWNLPGSADWEAETPHDQPLVEEARERGWPCCLGESEVHALVFQWRGVEGKLKTK